MPTSPTTPTAIRDRIATVIAAISPTSLSADKFREHREEQEFIAWAETKPASVLRRYSVDDIGEDIPPETSSGVEEERVLMVRVTIAYPKTARYGTAQATDRERVIREDQFKIERAIGMHGAANFTPPDYPDAAWIADRHTVDRQEGDACDYLVISMGMLYVLDVSA